MSEHVMRAKFRVNSVTQTTDRDGAVTSERVIFTAVARNDNYPADGSDENNTFSRYTPSASLDMTFNNPAILGKLNAGDEVYCDFTIAKKGPANKTAQGAG